MPFPLCNCGLRGTLDTATTKVLSSRRWGESWFAHIPDLPNFSPNIRDCTRFQYLMMHPINASAQNASFSYLNLLAGEKSLETASITHTCNNRNGWEHEISNRVSGDNECEGGWRGEVGGGTGHRHQLGWVIRRECGDTAGTLMLAHHPYPDMLTLTPLLSYV